jgi:hypothetical protein
LPVKLHTKISDPHTAISELHLLMTDPLIPTLFHKYFFPLYMLDSPERVHQMILNGKQVRIWNEVVVAYLKVLCWHLLEEADKKITIWEDGSLPESSTGYLPIITSQCYHYTNLTDPFHLILVILFLFLLVLFLCLPIKQFDCIEGS